MSTEENKAVIRRWIEVWNTGDVGVLQEIIAPDYVRHVSSGTNRPESGPEWYGQAVTGIRTEYPDHHVTMEAVIAEGDMVVTRWTAVGTHRGQSRTSWGATIPPTGKKVTWTGITITRLAGGKIAEEWWEADFVGRLKQLGVLPATPGS